MTADAYTNRPDLWYAVGNGRTDFCLWDLGHEGPTIPMSIYKKFPTWNKVKHIFLIDKEAQPQMLEIIQEDPRVHVWDSLVYKDLPQWHTYFWWWQTVKDVDQSNNLSGQLINPMDSGENLFLFECMLGIKKPQSDFLYQKILKNTNLLSCTFLNYLATGHNWVPACNLDVANILIPNKPGGSGILIPYNQQGQQANISTILPVKIYNQSWFSIYVESRKNHTRFFSEKTAKCLLGLRLFVIFSAPGMLKDLKTLGFQTFDTIIDETYDTILDDETRWNHAFDQVIWLSKQNPKEIYQQVHSILEHNRRHFLSIDWTQQMLDKMHQLLYCDK